MSDIVKLLSFENRVALVTGGAGFIGKETLRSFLELGACVAALDLPQKCEALTELFGGSSRFLAIPADLEDTTTLQRIPETVAASFGHLDILINCAALVGTTELVGWNVEFQRQSIDTWRRALEVNLTAVFALSQAAYPFLKQYQRGSIVNIASIYGIVGPDWGLYEGLQMGNPAAYAASKGGLVQLTRWLATTLAPNVRVNCVSPGGVYRTTPEPFLSRYISRTPLKRMAHELDVVAATVFLASDMASYITGHNLIVDGGWTVW